MCTPLSLPGMVLCGLLTAVSPKHADTQPPPESPRAISEFKPSLHGFKFANSFTGSRLPAGLGKLESALGAPTRYGLCGGMSFAAADYFLARIDIPATAKAPAAGTPLFKYISTRQNDSLGDKLQNAPRFAQWMMRSDSGLFGVRELTLAELHAIVTQIDSHHPALLGLVFSSRGEKPVGEGGAVWENHQVLAYAAQHHSPTAIDLRIYDPNYPGADDALIRCRIAPVTSDLAAPMGGWRVPVFGALCVRVVPGYRSTPVRGVFQMPFTPVAPPGLLR